MQVHIYYLVNNNLLYLHIHFQSFHIYNILLFHHYKEKNLEKFGENLRLRYLYWRSQPAFGDAEALTKKRRKPLPERPRQPRPHCRSRSIPRRSNQKTS